MLTASGKKTNALVRLLIPLYLHCFKLEKRMSSHTFIILVLLSGNGVGKRANMPALYEGKIYAHAICAFILTLDFMSN
jgi:hypothetical protein